jgi:hypothetical protein
MHFEALLTAGEENILRWLGFVRMSAVEMKGQGNSISDQNNKISLKKNSRNPRKSTAWSANNCTFIKCGGERGDHSVIVKTDLGASALLRLSRAYRSLSVCMSNGKTTRDKANRNSRRNFTPILVCEVSVRTSEKRNVSMKMSFLQGEAEMKLG